MIRKERQSRSYRLSAYFLAKSLSEMPILCVLPTINISIIYFMVGFPYRYAHPPADGDVGDVGDVHPHTGPERPLPSAHTARSLGARVPCDSAATFFAYLFTIFLTALTWQSIALFIGATVLDFQRGTPPNFLRCRRPPRPLTVPGKGAPAAAAFPLSGRSGVHHHPRLDALGWLLLAGAGPTPARPHTRTPARALISKRRDWLRAGARPSSRQRGSCGPATCPRQRTRISSCSGSSWCRRKCGRATSPPPPCPRAPTARVPSPATKSWGPLYGRFGRFGQACGWGGGAGARVLRPGCGQRRDRVGNCGV